MMNFDFWYGDKLENVTHITVTFSDLDCIYRGNMYIGSKIVGDFWTQDSTEITKYFPYKF